MVEQLETLRRQLNVSKADKTVAVEVLCAVVQQQQRDVTAVGAKLQVPALGNT